MPTETPTVETRDPVTRWVVAGILTGIILEVIQLPLASASDLRPVGATIGIPTALGGTIQELLVSIVVLIIFAAIVSGTSLRKYTTRLRTLVVLGIAYMVLVWAIYTSLILPFWERAVGLNVPFPSFELVVLDVHIVFGILIGVIYYVTLSWLRRRDHVELKPTSPG